jgi:hypothetical protein
MKTGIYALIALLAGQNAAHASALVVKDDAKGTLSFITQINYYGSAATADIAKKSSEEISRMWNESGAVVNYKGKNYRAQFIIGYDVNNGAVTSNSCGANYVEVTPLQVQGDRSFYSLGGRTGHFYTSDDLGNSTTTAHEFGHGYGLEHDDGYQLDADVPGIMFARGTLVKKQYQWNPNAEPGQAGGTLNPKYRHVRAEDVAKIDVNSIVMSNNMGCLGQGTATALQLKNVIPVQNQAHRMELESVSISNPGLMDELNAEANDAR